MKRSKATRTDESGGFFDERISMKIAFFKKINRVTAEEKGEISMTERTEQQMAAGSRTIKMVKMGAMVAIS